ncbi:MAG: hypothetical protein ACI8PT_003300 [Gammaproteobacteria bacterium]|jgi:hypothetical protein
MFAPVMVGVVRLVVVATIGAAAAVLSWEVNAVFAAVAAGLSVIGVVLALCMRGAPWHGRAN